MKKLIIIIIVLLLFIGVGVGGWFFYKNQKADWEKKLKAVEAQLASYGTPVSVVTPAVKLKAGIKVTEEMLSSAQIPSGLVSGTYIQDPEEVIGKIPLLDIDEGSIVYANQLDVEAIRNDDREYDLVCDSWTINLQPGDYIDVNMVYPYGEHYTILSHLRVLGINGQTVKVKLSATEKQMIEAAYVDKYLSSKEGLSITFDKYVAGGLQEPSKVTYAIPDNILAVIISDPNIIDKVKTDLNALRRKIQEGGTVVVESEGEKIQVGREDRFTRVNEADTALREAALEEEAKKAEQGGEDGGF